MFILAFKSLSISNPQSSQMKTLSDRESLSFLNPQLEQTFELG
jgi:hypothetical protein